MPGKNIARIILQLDNPTPQDTPIDVTASCYPNLLIVDESNLTTMVPATFNDAVTISVPHTISNEISFYALRDAIQQQFQVDIQLQNMSKYKDSYIVHIPQSDTKDHMITVRLNLLPSLFRLERKSPPV